MAEQQVDRYARQRLIPWWNQQRIAAAKIVVAGAGAVGNEAIKNLSLLGVGKLLIIDFDRVEASNLSRCVLFREADIGVSKVQAAARAVAELNPEVEVAVLNGDISCDLGEGEVREYDMVLGCVDSIAARWELNRLCRRSNVPWLNAGIGAAVGEVSLYHPQVGACYECGMTRSMWHRLNERRSCLLVGKPIQENASPATAVLASLTAALLVQEAVTYLHGNGDGQRLKPGEMLMVNTSPYEITVVSSTWNPHCSAHEVYGEALRISASPDELTAEKLMAFVPEASALVLEFDLVIAFECERCGIESVLLPLRSLHLQMLVCPHCKGQRAPQLAHEVALHSRMARASLKELGITHRAILNVKTRNGIQPVELLAPRPETQAFCR